LILTLSEFGTLIANIIMKPKKNDIMKQFSDFKKGDMFFFNPLDKDYMKPEVYVMMDEGKVRGYSTKTFIKNSALVKMCIGNYQPYPSDIWALTDCLFKDMAEAGHITPIDDIREAEAICDRLNLQMEEIL
jgi:hypothetical protein